MHATLRTASAALARVLLTFAFGLRIVHSVIRGTHTRVMQRLAAFGTCCPLSVLPCVALMGGLAARGASTGD